VVASKVMLILELLSDGKWHGVDELLVEAGLCERRFREIVLFLGKYDFVTFDEEKLRVKVNKDFKRLLAQPVS
jgi:hypothetical protein